MNSYREEEITRQITKAVESVSLPDDWVEEMLDRLQSEQDILRVAARKKRAELDAEREELQTKRNRAEEGSLDGVISKSRYREIKSDLTDRRQAVDSEIANLERHGGNRLEPMARFLKASRRAKKLASDGSPAEKRDFFKKTGSNPKLVARTLVFSPRGAWQHVEKSTLLVPAPGSDMLEPGTKPENTFAFSESGEGGIRSGQNR